ncbi:MAG: ATP synthase F1 subunit epsilon [bacterium]|nr:ATP synthase F1 subunit epsilon [bacterium]
MSFKLSIVSPERILFEDEVVSLVVPGGEGYLGILSNHAPLISTLKVGEIKFRDKNNKELWMATSGGFIEVSNNKATILADTAEFVHEIDHGRAMKELERAEGLLNMDLSSTDREVAKHSREKAKNRLDCIKKHK